MNKFIQTCLLLLALSTFAGAQSLKVTGKLTAKEDASVLQGVTVTVKGAKIGTLTDAKGEFAITLPSPNETLVFTYIGYLNKEVPVKVYPVS